MFGLPVMKYYLDTEFNGFGGDLLSLALVREDNSSLYLIYDFEGTYDPWVKANVVPILLDFPDLQGNKFNVNQISAPYAIQNYLLNDNDVHIISDWPDDIRYFCQSIITGPGMMISIPKFTFSVERVDAYPTKLKGAVQHNALWDALALKTILQGNAQE
jgi:hypothetical protein